MYVCENTKACEVDRNLTVDEVSILLQFVPEEEHGVIHDLYEPFLVPRARIVSTLLSIVEILEGGESRDVVLLTDRVELGAVQSSKDSLLVFSEMFGRLLVLWLGCLAVATPGSIKHH